MTVCPKCKGKAEYFKEVFNDGKQRHEKLVECDMCHGSGEVPMTNEEWFTSLSTEEKAKRIINIAVNSDCDYRTIVEWLKQPHK